MNQISTQNEINPPEKILETKKDTLKLFTIKPPTKQFKAFFEANGFSEGEVDIKS
jgi:hypothetical protein